MIVVELACAEVVCARIVRAPGDADAAPDHVHRRQLLFERDCLGELSLVIEGWVETIEVCRGQRRVLGWGNYLAGRPGLPSVSVSEICNDR